MAPLSKDQQKPDHPLKKAFVKAIGFSDKTLWDWLNLLGVIAVPFVIALVGWWFSAQQSQVNLQIADDRQKEDVLVNYQKDISDLLLNYGLDSSTEKKPAQQIARTKTLTALRRLDPLRKGFLMQFLYEANLIKNPSPTISLQDADLSDIRLGSSTGLNTPSVYSIPIGEHNHCHLSGINLDSADLKNADLRNADLSSASLFGAYLNGANLLGANLVDATVTPEQLAQTYSLKDAILPNGSRYPSSSYPIPHHQEPTN